MNVATTAMHLATPDVAPLGGFDAAELAARFGTPFYAYDLDAISGRVAALRAVLPSGFDIAYAVKANPSLGVVAHLGGLGLGADVASAGELATVLRAGIPARGVVMTGPGKRDEELSAAVAAGIRAITVESGGELARLARIAREAGRRVPILLRAAVPTAGRLERVRLVGDDGAGKFGMDSDELIVAARTAASSAEVELVGIHAFGASNVTDAAALATHIAGTMALARQVSAATGIRLRLVDVGGGLGIPYAPGETSLDLAALGALLERAARDWTADPLTSEGRVLVEPGRFLVGPAGTYVARVVDRKSVGGRTVVILDGGIHHLLRPALVGQYHRVRVAGRAEPGPGQVQSVTIAGPLCSGLDVLASDVALVPPQPGDLVAVLDVGAYGFTESMPFFLSHPVPAEIAVRGGDVALLRPRLDPGTWLGWQRLPDWA